ncbi:MAG: UDP-3-O-(3-hydroxymyristoyl)glucosamine N-acyltransferase [candidate division KSB1 bacterium]|nr:UDP-3-O-(3-hydroxymyristoyl)glucosamine N-acyltransferase [candidate division KSB1 bacterium]
MPFSLAEIASWVGATIEGERDITISGLAKIEEATPGTLTFIANPKYAKYIESTAASAVLVDRNFPSCAKTLLRTDDPYFAFLVCARRFYQREPAVAPGVHPTAVIGEGTHLGKNVSIGAYTVIGKNCRIGDGSVIYPLCFIGDNVQIGSDTLIYANVSVREECRIGSRCIIHMGAVIGADGFGFAFKDGRYHKLPQMGIVVIEDDVEIGANTTIDRATLGETIIRSGAKLDNLIQVAHNVEIGEHTAIAAQTGISGSTKIGRYVVIGGQAGFAGHIQIGDQAKIGAQAGITKSVAGGEFVTGTPARPFLEERREQAALARLPELLKQVRDLQKRVDELASELSSYRSDLGKGGSSEKPTDHQD